MSDSAAMGLRRLVPLLLVAATFAAGASTAAALTSFASPSRNIGCIGDRTEIRCDIGVSSATPPPRPRACDQEWGDAFRIRPTGRARGVCHGDTALPAPGQKVRILAYGTGIRLGTLVCRSRRTGLTCRNAGGHGFRLSREVIRLF